MSSTAVLRFCNYSFISTSSVLRFSLCRLFLSSFNVPILLQPALAAVVWYFFLPTGRILRDVLCQSQTNGNSFSTGLVLLCGRYTYIHVRRILNAVL